MMMKSPFRAFLPFVVGIAAGSCALNPATGNNELMLVSEAQEIEMGRQGDAAVVQSIGLYADPVWQSYIQRFGARLAATSERPNLPWTFRVVDDPAINAFAIPGGFIYVTRGLLAHLTSEAQLASVVGHEIGHVTARHTAAAMSKEQLVGLGLAVGSLANKQIAKYAGTASQALGLLFLKFSRDNETQADQLGLRYMVRGGYDPREMAGVFVMLEREGDAAGNAGRLPTWMATHPSPANRITAINRQVAALPQDFAGTSVNRDSYERLLDGIVFGINPRQGFFSGGQFFHPDLRFQIAFPSGWGLNNGAQAVIGVSPAKDAAIELAQAAEPSADAATRAFVALDGITSGSSARVTLSGGLAAISTPFAAAAEGGTVRGTVLFVEYGGAVYGIVAYAPEARWSTYQAVAEGAERSFRPLTDPAALNVQPRHMDIVTLVRTSTIGQMALERSSPISAATLAIINQVEVQTPFASGRLVKWVIGL